MPQIYGLQHKEPDRFGKIVAVTAGVVAFFVGMAFVGRACESCDCANTDRAKVHAPMLEKQEAAKNAPGNRGAVDGVGKLAIISAYTSRPKETDRDGKITASNKEVYYRLVANNCLPYGTKVQFPDLYGELIFVVDDVMNRRYGCEHFDIWVGYGLEEDVQIAKRIGRRQTTYRVVR